jgi:hypothetical protein
VYPFFLTHKKRISGTLLGRIDIHIEALHLDNEKLSGEWVVKPLPRSVRRGKPAQYQKRLSPNGSANKALSNPKTFSGSGTLLEIIYL